MPALHDIHRENRFFFYLFFHFNVLWHMCRQLLICAPNDDSNQPAHSRSLISLRCPHEETLHPWLSKMRPVKTLIRLRECAGWSETSQGALIRRYVFLTLRVILWTLREVRPWQSCTCNHPYVKWNLKRTFIPTLDATTKFVIMTIWLSWNIRLKGNN